MDFGGNFIIGFMLKKGFTLVFNYAQGIRDLSPVQKNDNRINTTSFGIKVGWFLKNK
jgi:hypothetical protein